MDYLSIDNYGIIGNQRTVALVSAQGSIDFMCFPEYDSPSIFAALLDCKKGGFFQIIPFDNNIRSKQIYISDTNILLTRFLTDAGTAELIDFMPISKDGLIRRITNLNGKVTFQMKCNPRFNYSQETHQTTLSKNEIIFKSKKLNIKLKSSVPLKIVNGDGFATFTLQKNEQADFYIEYDHNAEKNNNDLNVFIDEMLAKTTKYWKDWIAKSKYEGLWKEKVERSALTLKLLVAEKYGSIVAAPTFSLPEKIGGGLNWDYRFCWIRDSSFALQALMKMGYLEETEQFLNWIQNILQKAKGTGSLQLVYGIDGRPKIPEKELKDFEGYKGSYPVRIGNDAYEHKQQDIYGELIDCIYVYSQFKKIISKDLWDILKREVDWLCDHWWDKGYGIWEARKHKRQFLYAFFMSWLAIDRAIKIAIQGPYPLPTKWTSVKNQIYESIFKEFWDPKIKAFVAYKGCHHVDASALIMPLRQFISPIDPLWLSTLKRIEIHLLQGSKIYRYPPEEAQAFGLKETHEGSFTMCSFWYVECLARKGDVEKAKEHFERLLSYSNHLGLYSEEINSKGELTGNFPQAFSHFALIMAANELSKLLNPHSFYL